MTAPKGIKNEIIRLYNEGFSYSEIKNKLNCSKGSIAYALRDKDKRYFGKTRECIGCGSLILKKQKRCKSCHMKYSTFVRDDMTLGELKNLKHGRQNIYTKVRMRARNVAKKQKWCKCSNCLYDKHTEVCHIKPIADFDDQTTISEINSLDNMMPLCPNCHWEFDHNMLELKDIKHRPSSAEGGGRTLM